MEQPHDAAGGPDGDELARMGAVDAAPGAHEPTVDDEPQILAELYGPADERGFYTGQGPDEVPDAGEPG